jgi:hypothetical protein
MLTFPSNMVHLVILWCSLILLSFFFTAFVTNNPGCGSGGSVGGGLPLAWAGLGAAVAVAETDYG